MSYADILSAIMRERPEVVVLTAEARGALGTIPKDFPDRFYDFGIAEQNLVNAAAGMAAMGKVPIIHSPLATFITMRSFEQIRTTVGIQHFNVKIPGLLPGFAGAYQGPTHTALEDLGLMRAIPGMTVMAAASETDLKDVMAYAFATNGPVYFRVPPGLPGQLPYVAPVEPITQSRSLRTGKAGLVIATGGMVARTLKAIEHGPDVTLVNLSMLKPVPADALAALIRSHKKVATVEEHFVTGGLGSTIAEVIAGAGLGAKLRRIGVEDAFPDRYATYEETLRYIGLDAAGIAAKLKEFFG